MNYLEIIILAVVQGLTEFLPISSSGHLILAPYLFNFKDPGLALDAILHLGTLFAIIIYFREDLSKLFLSLFDRKADAPTRQLAFSILLASIPAGLVGLFGESLIEKYLRSPSFVASNLLVWSVVFWIADRFAVKPDSTKPVDKKSKSEIEDMSLGQVMLIGCAQALALLPGTSRSGITIAAGLFSNLSYTAAARFSFLLGTPIIMAAGLHSSVSVISNPDSSITFSFAQIAVGFFTTFVIGYFSIALLLKIVAKAGLLPFIIYRILLSVSILIFV